MRAVSTGEWKTYVVTEKKVYSGELKDYLVRGMEFDFNGAKVRYNNQEFVAPHVRGLIRKGWAKEVEPEAPAPTAPPKNAVDRSLEAKSKSIKVLPDGWSGMHWKHKVQYIETCTDPEILKNIRRVESRAVKATAEERLEELQDAAPKTRGPTPSIEVEEVEDLARATGAQPTPSGDSEDDTTGGKS